MPYIEDEGRERFREALEAFPKTLSKGELNYVVSMLAIKHLARIGLNYQNASDAHAALQDAANEFNRRQLAPYEDHKAAVNGDLPWLPVAA